MISSLHGTVLSTAVDQVVLEVGGVGFLVFVPGDVARAAHVGQQLRLHTSLIVREDSMTLYGFAEPLELEVFGHLLSVTGVGPKSALGVLGHLSVAQIAGAVSADDDAPFRRVSGIGPKTAKLIVVQLAGKLQAAAIEAADPPANGAADDVVAQVTTALVGLGWSEKVAAEAAASTAEQAGDSEPLSVSSLLRRTLAVLGPAQSSATKSGGARG